MGLNPKEYYMLTPVEFGLMYNGFLNKEKKQLKNVRRLSWHIIRGYADPKDLPKTMEAWWPIDDDDLETAKQSNVDIPSWDEDKRKAAEDMIKKVTGG